MGGLGSIQALCLAIDALDNGYKFSEVCMKYEIPRSSLRDHYVEITKSTKIGPKGVLTMEEETILRQYLEEMVRISCPLNTTQLKLKVAEIIQGRSTQYQENHG